MFTGIVEDVVEVIDIELLGSNKKFIFSNPWSDELYIDQSIAHNGVCLTVEKIWEGKYQVTAILETLKKTNLDNLKIGDFVNVERSALVNARIDGHFVQGHVDKTVPCVGIQNMEGSWEFEFALLPEDKVYIVKKGSVCINGVSLTIADMPNQNFKVAIIPYTYQYTNFKNLNIGETVNIEFDILGKYIIQYIEKIVPKT
ncbi:MAG: riboflavin synthase [Saprospiraceae bacterium]